MAAYRESKDSIELFNTISQLLEDFIKENKLTMPSKQQLNTITNNILVALPKEVIKQDLMNDSGKINETNKLALHTAFAAGIAKANNIDAKLDLKNHFEQNLKLANDKTPKPEFKNEHVLKMLLTMLLGRRLTLQDKKTKIITMEETEENADVKEITAKFKQKDEKEQEDILFSLVQVLNYNPQGGQTPNTATVGVLNTMGLALTNILPGEKSVATETIEQREEEQAVVDKEETNKNINITQDTQNQQNEEAAYETIYEKWIKNSTKPPGTSSNEG